MPAAWLTNMNRVGEVTTAAVRLCVFALSTSGNASHFSEKNDHPFRWFFYYPDIEQTVDWSIVTVQQITDYSLTYLRLKPMKQYMNF
jgi:hypothetical protein